MKKRYFGLTVMVVFSVECLDRLKRGNLEKVFANPNLFKVKVLRTAKLNRLWRERFGS